MVTTMNPEIAIQWIERLETLPPETQGRGALNRNGKMCCLGVLCEIAVENKAINPARRKVSAFIAPDESPTMTYNDETYYLPYDVVQWAGIKSGDDEPWPARNNHNPLIQGKNAGVWNDDERLSFKEIAALLRKEFNLPKED